MICIMIFQWHQKKSEEMLSPIRLEIKNKYDIKAGGTNKLIPYLLPKKELCSAL